MTKTVRARPEHTEEFIFSPFALKPGETRDTAIYESIRRREAGEPFLTAEESLANMRAAIRRGAGHDI